MMRPTSQATPTEAGANAPGVSGASTTGTESMRTRVRSDSFLDSEQWTHKKLHCVEVQMGHRGHWNMVHYDAKLLLRSMGLGTLFCQGTVFTLTRDIYINMVAYGAVCIIIAFAVVNFDLSNSVLSELRDGFSALADTQKRLTPFVFGLFISLTMKRWWELRLNELGMVMGAIVQCVSFVNQIGCRVDMSAAERRAFNDDCLHMTRLGVASLECVAQRSQGDFSFDELMKEGILTVEESRILEDHGGRAFVLWSWIQSLGASLLDETLPASYAPNHNPWMTQCAHASYAVSRMEAFQDSQLPFPYVHMLVMLVGANNWVMCVLLGLNMAAHWRDGPWSVTVPDILNLLLVPSMYQALLQICSHMEDPLGNDLTDFPVLALQATVYDASRDMMRACHAFWQHRKAAGISDLWLGGPKQKPKAPISSACPLPVPIPVRRTCPSKDASDLLLQTLRASLGPNSADEAADRPACTSGSTAVAAKLSALALEHGYSELPTAHARAALAREAVGHLLPLGAPVICMLGADDKCGGGEAVVAAIAGRSAERLAELGAVVVLLAGQGSTQRAFVSGFGDDFPAVFRLVPQGTDGAAAACHARGIQWQQLLARADSTLLADILGLLCDVCLAAAGGPELAGEVQAALDRGAAVLPVCCGKFGSSTSSCALNGASGFQLSALQRPSWATDDEWNVLLTPVSPASLETVAATAADLLCSRAAACAEAGDRTRGDSGGRRRRALAKMRRECRAEELRLRDYHARLRPSSTSNCLGSGSGAKITCSSQRGIPLLRLPDSSEPPAFWDKAPPSDCSDYVSL